MHASPAFRCARPKPKSRRRRERRVASPGTANLRFIRFLCPGWGLGRTSCFGPSRTGVGRARSAGALSGCLARCAPGSPSALWEDFSSDSPGPPHSGVPAFGHRTNSAPDLPAPGAADWHSAPVPQEPWRRVSWGAISAELTAESEDRTRGPVRGFRATCSGLRCTHSLRSGMAWVGPLRKTWLGPRGGPSLPARAREVRRAFAHSGHLGSHFMPV